MLILITLPCSSKIWKTVSSILIMPPIFLLSQLLFFKIERPGSNLHIRINIFFAESVTNAIFFAANSIS